MQASSRTGRGRSVVGLGFWQPPELVAVVW